MAKYRVEIDISFDNEKDALALLNYVEQVKAKAFAPISKTAATIGVTRNCRVHLCYHDETPSKPCSTYTNVDFNSITKEHTTIEVPK